jgi:hypothetical protein
LIRQVPQTLSPKIVPTVENINKTASMAEFSIPEPTQGKQDILVESILTWGQPM